MEIPTFKDYKEIIVGVYAIAHNEAKFIERWLDSMKEADFIYVCENNHSSDGTYELFKKHAETNMKGKLFVDRAEVKPFRFDVARNVGMEMIPTYAEGGPYLLICTDIDETLEPGWADAFRKAVFKNPLAAKYYYKYAWSHLPSGAPDRVFWYDKAHLNLDRGWSWEFPCHETMRYDGDIKYGPSVYIDDGETIWLHHWPDNEKSRGSYLGLLELRAKEYPQDSYGIFYLARELGFANRWEEAMAWYQRLYCRLHGPNAIDDMMMKPMVALEIARIYDRYKMKEEAEFFFKRAIALDERVMDSWASYAQWLAYQGRPEESLKILSEGKKKSVPIQDWRTVPALSSSWKENQIIADAMSWFGRYDIAWNVIQEGLAQIEESNDKTNALYQGFYYDYKFIEAKVNGGQK